MPAVEELAAAWQAARPIRCFAAEIGRARAHVDRRPAPLSPAPAARRGARRRPHLAQARGPRAHRLAQDQQLRRSGAARAAHGQAPHHRRDRRGPARGRDRHRVCALRAAVRGVHGRGRRRAARSSTSSACACSAPRCAGRRGLGHAQGRDQRGAARLGRARRRHPLRDRQRDGARSLSDDGARAAAGDRREAKAQLHERHRSAARRGGRVRGRGAATRSGSSPTSSTSPASRWSASRRPARACTAGTPPPWRAAAVGIYHGMRSLVLQDEDGQTARGALDLRRPRLPRRGPRARRSWHRSGRARVPAASRRRGRARGGRPARAHRGHPARARERPRDRGAARGAARASATSACWSTSRAAATRTCTRWSSACTSTPARGPDSRWRGAPPQPRPPSARW